MITMFTVEKLLETFTKKPKTPPKRKLQRSPKIIGYERECSDQMFISSDLKEPLLSYEDKIDYYDDQPKIMKEVYNKSSNNNTNYSNSNNSTRVKVILTKEEAKKLLAKCKEENTLEFQDVVMQLAKLPAQRINVVGVTSLTDTTSKDLDLAPIIEEDGDEDEDEDE